MTTSSNLLFRLTNGPKLRDISFAGISKDFKEAKNVEIFIIFVF